MTEETIPDNCPYCGSEWDSHGYYRCNSAWQSSGLVLQSAKCAVDMAIAMADKGEHPEQAAFESLSGEIQISRTGRIYSFASTEYSVTYPDGHIGTIWSPPWHEMDDNEEDEAARRYAESLFRAGNHK